jgi:hypothetical protein
VFTAVQGSLKSSVRCGWCQSWSCGVVYLFGTAHTHSPKRLKDPNLMREYTTNVVAPGWFMQVVNKLAVLHLKSSLALSSGPPFYVDCWMEHLVHIAMWG